VIDYTTSSNINLLSIYKNNSLVASIHLDSAFEVTTKQCDSSSTAKLTLDLTKLNEWLMIGVSYLTTSTMTKGVITIGNCAD
jgi:hypothetical protein